MSVSVIAFTELLGARVRDADGRLIGQLRDGVVLPQEATARVAFLVVVGPEGERLIALGDVESCGGRLIRVAPGIRGETVALPEALFLKRDLLDQQVIDVHGRKVVRVNDIDLEARPTNGRTELSVLDVDVGARGALRRLGKGLLPRRTLRALLARVPTRAIPWHFVDLIEADPARRVKLKIAYEGLAKLHPADIADIIEDLPPAERESVFETIDEEIAAGALEELQPKIKVAVVQSLDSERAADIVEEMAPDAAADLLADLPAEDSGAILSEMAPEERQPITRLLEFGQKTAAGRMTTEFLALPVDATVRDGMESLRTFPGGFKSALVIYLLDRERELCGGVTLLKIATATPATPLRSLTATPMITCSTEAGDEEVAELFDKYNLLTLPVVDDHQRLVGIITADDVLSLLRHRG